jgi:curved DNA-binding protein CbpA
MTELPTDLYAVLGVPRDADRAAIRRAYRAKARGAHPDSGGSPQDFVRVKAAYDTLIDADRRRRYDETGEVGDVPIDTHRAELVEMLFTGLDLALLKLSRRSRPPKHANLVWLTAEALRLRRQEWTGQRQELEKAAELSRELRGRFVTASGDSLMEGVIERRVAICQTEIEGLDKRIKLVDEALEALQEVTFQADDDSQPALDQQWKAMSELVRRFG